jgi:pyruvate dehydrogenase kinase 2/3/4
LTLRTTADSSSPRGTQNGQEPCQTTLKDCRLAHRLRDIQTLPYVVVANPHLAHVYESYLRAFERFRKVPEIRSLEDNEKYCKVLEETLTEHATVIPRLAIGVLEVRGLMKPEETDKFMTTMLRSVRHGLPSTDAC